MKKFLSVSTIFACISFIFALAFLILYAVNVNVDGYFQGIKATNVVMFAVIALVLDLIIVVGTLPPVHGYAKNVVDVIICACKAFVPMLLAFGAMNLLSARLEGIGYILFSNVDVAKEVATPANVSSAVVSIVAISVALVAMLVSIVGAFMLPKEKEAVVE